MNIKLCFAPALRLLIVISIFAQLSISFAQTTTLPVYESFDNATNPLNYTQNSGIFGLPGWSYEADGTSDGRLSFRQDFETHAGSRYIASLDNPGGESVNRLLVNVDAAGLVAADGQVLLSFDWYDHGDEGDVVDLVEVRGSSADSWVQVYSFAANSNNGSWTQVRDIDLSQALISATQQFSATTQVRFSQNDNFPINTDGISIENVSIEVADSQDSESASPEILIAKMVNYQGRSIPSGGEIEYKVSIINPSDITADVADDVVFELAQFSAETTLVAGSVITSQGSVVTGNITGDTDIRVELGDLLDGTSATVYFRAVATFDGNFQFFNQGAVSANNVSAFLTEDPLRSNSGTADQTLANFVLPTTLPIYESFDTGNTAAVYQANNAGDKFLIDGISGWSYVGETTNGRFQFRSDFTRRDVAGTAGSGLIASMDNPGGESINRSIVTFDASQLSPLSDQLLLSFDWYDHGDEGDVVDLVEVRGSSADSWVQVYSFAANSDNGSWTQVRDIDLSSALANANPPQGFTEASQVRFGQNDNFPINTDGISLEDVSIELAPSASETDSQNPDSLIASMIDYAGQDVIEGESLEYKVSIINKADNAGESATSVVFELPQVDAEFDLLVGSVFSSQGSVISGNTTGDTTVRVELGDIADGQSATIYFRTTPKFTGTLDFFIQGEVSANNIVQFTTEDPTRSAGTSDQTIASFARIQRAISNFSIDDNQPVVGDPVTASATGSGSSEAIIYSSDTPAICQISLGSSVELLTRGDCTLRASQAGDVTYLDADEVILTFFIDNDTIDDTIDNCPIEANEDQADFDLDGIGDVCDTLNNARLTLTPATFTFEEGLSGQARVIRSSSVTAPLVVILSSSSGVMIPASVTIAAGASQSEPFTISSDDDQLAQNNRTASLVARAAQHTNATATVNIIEDDFDTDIDGILDRDDNCPINVNSDQADLDLDGVGDVCDLDDDGDSIQDTSDNCPINANPDQADFERDGLGDVCDPDDDGDGMSDAYEEANGLDPRNSLDRDADPDGDGFTNGEEAEFDTDPNVANDDDNNNGIPDVSEERRMRAVNALPAIYELLLLD